MHRKYCFQESCDYNVLWSSLHNLGQRYFWIDSSIGYLERVWLVFFIKEKNLVILWYLILTVLGGATEVTLAVAGEGPILVELQFSQHLCQPLQTSNCIIWTVQSCYLLVVQHYILFTHDTHWKGKMMKCQEPHTLHAFQPQPPYT